MGSVADTIKLVVSSNGRFFGLCDSSHTVRKIANITYLILCVEIPGTKMTEIVLQGSAVNRLKNARNSKSNHLYNKFATESVCL